MKTFRNFKTFGLDTLAAIRELTAAISDHNQRVSELHADIKKIETSVGYLHRAERHNREARGQKVNV